MNIYGKILEYKNNYPEFFTIKIKINEHILTYVFNNLNYLMIHEPYENNKLKIYLIDQNNFYIFKDI